MTPLASFGLRILAAAASTLAFLLILICLGMVAVLIIALMIAMPFLAVLNATTLLILGKTLHGKSVKQLWNEG